MNGFHYRSSTLNYLFTRMRKVLIIKTAGTNLLKLIIIQQSTYL